MKHALARVKGRSPMLDVGIFLVVSARVSVSLCIFLIMWAPPLNLSLVIDFLSKFSWRFAFLLRCLSAPVLLARTSFKLARKF